MRGTRLDHILAGTAAILLLTASGAVLAQSNEAAIEAAIPVPQPANVPPPSIADIGPVTGTTAAPTGQPRAVATAPAGVEKAPEPAATPAPAKEPAATPPAPTLASADQILADALRDAIAKKGDRLFDRVRKERAAVEAFYNTRNFLPVWIENGEVNARGKAAIAYLAKVDAEGLEPSDYPTPDFKAAAGDPNALAEAELRLNVAVLNFTRHARIGRVHFSRVSGEILYDLKAPEPADVLGRMVDGKDIAAALDSYNPQHPGYKALKAKLAEARNPRGNVGPVRIAAGPVLKYGKDRKGKEILMQDPRVPLLRERLGLPGEADNTTYDKSLADAVAAFQKKQGLSPSGQLSTATIDALNGPRRDRDAEIIVANMERWRWLPRDLGKAHSMLNIPDYTMKVVRDGATVWTTRVVVGKASTQTPLLSDTMKYITVNPTWNVPPSIIYNEYLPAMQSDPTVIQRMGIKVTQNRDGTVSMSQPPGDRNALGRIRFNFPNKFLVYQHDTPDKHLFGQVKRAYSHGCMRVQDPLKYAEILLSTTLPKEGYTQERLRKMFGTSEVDIRFPTPIPVHVTYQTAFVDDDGKLQMREDVYGHDARLLAVLKGEERKVADIAVPRAHNNTVPRPVQLPGQPSGPSFFEMLFGGAPQAAPPARQVTQQRRSISR